MGILTREKAIQEIEQLYPPDSAFPLTAAIGQELLAEAKRQCASWKNEPDAVIFELLNLCRETLERITNLSKEILDGVSTSIELNKTLSAAKKETHIVKKEAAHGCSGKESQ